MEQRTRSTEHLLEALMRLTRSLKAGRFRTDAAGVELGRAEVGVLRWIERHGEARTGDIACGFGLSASVISRQLTSLEERGLLTRRADPADARAGLVSLTTEGVRALDAMTAYYNDRLAEILRDWSEDDLRGAARLVGHLADRLADAPDSPPATAPSTPALV
ncbi:MAG: MarR family winged helix-turn-helix transcriptional regulator [Nocardioidaceae bacterium]|nr:MarR family winged helix-turn-helix transcriptional regulator [Nocardioidaceae bacterium]